MEIENQPTISNAHQQIRLGDIQASTNQWSAAIDYYLTAIRYFKLIQSTLPDDSLQSLIEAQIVQCEKKINFFRLKDRVEQAIKIQQAENLTRMNRAYSSSCLKPAGVPSRDVPRQSQVALQNTDTLKGPDNMDTFTANIFNKKPNQKPSAARPVIAKKKMKHDSHIYEELRVSNEALKRHLQEAVENIERLKQENSQLRLQHEVNPFVQTMESKLSTNSGEECSEN